MFSIQNLEIFLFYMTQLIQLTLLFDDSSSLSVLEDVKQFSFYCIALLDYSIYKTFVIAPSSAKTTSGRKIHAEKYLGYSLQKMAVCKITIFKYSRTLFPSFLFFLESSLTLQTVGSLYYMLWQYHFLIFHNFYLNLKVYAYFEIT